MARGGLFLTGLLSMKGCWASLGNKTSFRASQSWKNCFNYDLEVGSQLGWDLAMVSMVQSPTWKVLNHEQIDQPDTKGKGLWGNSWEDKTMKIPTLFFCFWGRWLFSWRLPTRDCTANGKKAGSESFRKRDGFKQRCFGFANDKAQQYWGPLISQTTGTDKWVCVRQNHSLGDVRVLILEPVKITSHDKRDFTDMIKLKIKRWRDYVGRPNPISRLPI